MFEGYRLSSGEDCGSCPFSMNQPILGGLDQVACGEKCLGTGYNLKVGQAACKDDLDML